MKKTCILVIVILMAACKPLASKSEVEISGSDCPKDGGCSVKIFNNKSITTQSDENNANFHYEMIESTTKSTVVFEYSKNVPKGVMDAGLREEIAIEFDNNIKPGKYTDFSAVFGRFCYCKGSTGYYKIKDGTLTVMEDNGKRQFLFDFKVGEVPQIIRNIGFRIK